MIQEIDGVGKFHKPYTGYTQKAVITAKKFDKTSVYKGQLYIDCPKLFLTLSGTPAVAYIGGTDRISSYHVITGAEHAENIKHSLFNSKDPIAEYDEASQIFRIKGAQGDKVYLEGVLEKPSDFAAYGYDDGRDEGAIGSQYPMPQGPLDMLIGKMVKSYLGTMYRVPVQPNTQSDIPQRQGEPK